MPDTTTGEEDDSAGELRLRGGVAILGLGRGGIGEEDRSESLEGGGGGGFLAGTGFSAEKLAGVR